MPRPCPASRAGGAAALGVGSVGGAAAAAARAAAAQDGACARVGGAVAVEREDDGGDGERGACEDGGKGREGNGEGMGSARGRGGRRGGRGSGHVARRQCVCPAASPPRTRRRWRGPARRRGHVTRESESEWRRELFVAPAAARLLCGARWRQRIVEAAEVEGRVPTHAAERLFSHLAGSGREGAHGMLWRESRAQRRRVGEPWRC